MMSLGIESTAHTFGCGIITDDGNILANERSMHIPEIGKGMLPREAAEHHMQIAVGTIKAALDSAKTKMKNISLVSFSAGPGIPNCLRVGAPAARYISLKYKMPLVPVNHCIAHIEIGKLTTGSKDPVIVYLSGGNSQIIAFVEGLYRIFGETEDIPIGNALDVLAREMELPMPGGPQIEKLSLKGSFIGLPYVVKGCDLSFTGVTTEAVKKFKSGVSKGDVCYSMQETCFAMLTEVTERVLAHTGKKEVLLVGGVAANKRLQEMLNVMCNDRGARFHVVPHEYSGDQGAMIAWAGILTYKSKRKLPMNETPINQDWRVDEVHI